MGDQTWLVRVQGRVQGVGYRDSCVRYARRAGVRGWIRNRSDGSVELTLQGTAAQIAEMKDWLQYHVPAAHVIGMESTPLTGSAPLLGFERLPTL